MSQPTVRSANSKNTKATAHSGPLNTAACKTTALMSIKDIIKPEQKTHWTYMKHNDCL